MHLKKQMNKIALAIQGRYSTCGEWTIIKYLRRGSSMEEGYKMLEFYKADMLLWEFRLIRIKSVDIFDILS
jgi:hypothetical protein